MIEEEDDARGWMGSMRRHLSLRVGDASERVVIEMRRPREDDGSLRSLEAGRKVTRSASAGECLTLLHRLANTA
jgi:hypothetical protein